MSVTAGDGLVLAPSGRAHHSHLSSLARDGFAHLCTDFGVGLARARASSSALSTEPSIRFCPDTQTGHSSGSALFRKGTFGADYGVRKRNLDEFECFSMFWVGFQVALSCEISDPIVVAKINIGS